MPDERVNPNLDEDARLAAVRRYEILDTPPDGALDRVTALAARLFDVPISIVSIVDRDRIWFKSHHGTEVEETSRDPGLCASAILQDDVFVVPDATIDRNALANPLVAGELGLRFYAAAPLRTADGFNLGTLCVIDRKPRRMTREERATLADLAAIVVEALELRLAAHSEEERLERVRQDFTLTVSHELKTPLAAVYGAAKTLAREDGGISADTRKRLLAVISEQGERLRDMFEDVLATSQLESGRFQIVPGEFDPAELVRTAAEAARTHLPGNLRVEVEAPGDLPRVHGDAQRVRQVIENLVDNAVKYSPGGGRIEIGVHALGDRIRFWIRDEGIGVPPREQERIFGRFYRLDPEMRSGVAGTGLGLYVCHQLADRMGGEIELESREGEGSTFSLTLPLRQPATPSGSR